jgi:hypothetical protein
LSGRLIAAQAASVVRSNWAGAYFSFIAPTPDGAALMIMESAKSPWTYFQIRVLSVDRNARALHLFFLKNEYC